MQNFYQHSIFSAD